MKIKLKCCDCNIAKKGENLWYIDGKFYCAPCGMSYLYGRTSHDMEAVGYVCQDLQEALDLLTQDQKDYYYQENKGE